MAIFLTKRKQIISNQPHHVNKSEFRNLGNFACGTRKYSSRNVESSTWNPESTAWSPESKTVLDFLTGGDLAFNDTLTKFETASFGS